MCHLQAEETGKPINGINQSEDLRSWEANDVSLSPRL